MTDSFCDSQLWVWLDRAVTAGLIERTGAGRKRELFRYWLASRTDEPRDNELFLDELPPLDQGVVLRLAKAVVRSRYGRGSGRRDEAGP